MSGSSLDALDCALMRFGIQNKDIAEWHLVACSAIPLPEQWKTKLSELPTASLATFFQADVDFGTFIGVQCRSFLEEQHITPTAIVSHGHTILHNPEAGYSVQIGNPAFIARANNCQVISDLRSMDIAAGGQGAPLAPVAEKILFPGYQFYLNLGGIANLTHATTEGSMHAWDISPANQLLNYVSNTVGLPYDDRGLMARSGSIDEALLAQLREVTALPLRQPFSMDNMWIRQMYYPLLEKAQGSVADILASVTEYIARSVSEQIADQCALQADMQLMVTGGGAHNTFLLERIAYHITPVRLSVPSDEIIDFKEAMLMAVCGMLRLMERPNAYASVTGAMRDTVNGIITSAQRDLQRGKN